MHSISINEMKPTRALVFYDGSNQHVLVHNFDQNGQILHGKPLKRSAMNMLLSHYLKEFKSSYNALEIMPEQVLLHNPAIPMMIWWSPRCEREISFKGSVAYKVKWPPLLFIVKEGTLFLFALKKDQRPHAKTEIMHAPLWNLSDKGVMCRGSAVYPATLSPAEITQWENAVYDSAFSHPNGSLQRIKGFAYNKEELFWKTHSTTNRQFPTSKLYSTGKTLDQLIQELSTHE